MAVKAGPPLHRSRVLVWDAEHAPSSQHRKRKFWTDLDRVEEGAELPQKHLPHVVAATSVGQDQERRPAAPAGRRQLHKHTKAAVNAGPRPAPPEAPPSGPTLLYSSGCLRRSLLTRWR